MFAMVFSFRSRSLDSLLGSFFFSRINHFDFSIRFLRFTFFYCYPIDTPISFDLFETFGLFSLHEIFVWTFFQVL